jgi:hypothetical protein
VGWGGVGWGGGGGGGVRQGQRGVESPSSGLGPSEAAAGASIAAGQRPSRCSSCAGEATPFAPDAAPPPLSRRFAFAERSKAINTYEEGEAEYDLLFKVISHMIKREGLLVVVTAPRRAPDEGADAFRNRVWKERRLALSPSYVPE